MAYIWNLVTEVKRSVVYVKGALSFGNRKKHQNAGARRPVVILFPGASLQPTAYGQGWQPANLPFSDIMLSCSLRLAYLHGDKKFFSETG